MRLFLLSFILVLVTVSAVIVGFALATDQSQLILLAVVPALLCLPTLIVYLVVASRAARQQRQLGLVELAEKLGLRYSAEVAADVRSQLEQIGWVLSTAELLDQAQGERDGVTFTVLGCRVSGDGGLQRHHRYYSICWIPEQLEQVPAFELTENTLLPRTHRVSGGQEVKLIGDANTVSFSKRFHLQTLHHSDRGAVESLFDKELKTLCLSSNGVSYQVCKGSLLAWYTPTLSEDIRQANRSISENVSQAAESILNQALAIHQVLAASPME